MVLQKIKEWWRQNHSLRWVDTGDSWKEYETVWKTDHAANVHIKRRKVQKHPDTGEERTISRHVVGVTEPIEKFDSDGMLWERIPPKPETDAVVNPENKSDAPTRTGKHRYEEAEPTPCPNCGCENVKGASCELPLPDDVGPENAHVAVEVCHLCGVVFSPHKHG